MEDYTFRQPVVRVLFLIFFVTVQLFELRGQDGIGANALLEKQKIAVSTNPNEAIKIGEHLVNGKANADKVQYAKLLMAKAYFYKAEYLTSYRLLSEIPHQEKEATATDIEALFFKAWLLQTCGLKDEADKQIEKIKRVSSLHNKFENDLHLFETFVDKDSIGNAQLISLLSSLNASAKDQSTFIAAAELDLMLGEIYLEASKTDSAFHHLQLALAQCKIDTATNAIRAQALYQLGNYYFINKEHSLSISNLKKAELIATNIGNAALKQKAIELLASNYLAIGDVDAFFAAKQSAQLLANQNEIKYYETINGIHGEIGKHLEQELQITESRYHAFLKWGMVIILIVLLIAIAQEVLFRIRYNPYKYFEQYLQQRDAVSKNAEQLPQKVAAKVLHIPNETEQVIMEKLEQFEQGIGYTSKEMSLSQLAAQLETNTKYLSEIINRNKGKNFNQYINELRIGYVTDLVRNDPAYRQYKVSYLAETAGFSSHSSFATTFKAITGISPNTFVSMLQQEENLAHSNG